MKRLAYAAAIALALCFPVSAQTCQFTITDTVPQLEAQGIPNKVLDGDDLALFLTDLADAAELKFGQRPDLSMVTGAILAIIADEVMFGLVVDGCLTPPQPLAAYLPEEKRSGWTPVGVFA